MRLIDTTSLALETFPECPTGQYAILSHTWGADKDELNFDEFVAGHGREKIGFRKIRLCCEQARQEGLRYAWVDTCCIDKRSSAELSEAINSMFNWYAYAKVCYAYLADVCHHDSLTPEEWPSAFLQSRWFTRGWTLQELIAPEAAVFYTQEWEWIGSRSDLAKDIEKTTGISSIILKSGSRDSIKRLPIAERMSWASRRQTTRAEDGAYCLMGLFDINMPLLYGEGSKAFLRLQEEIIRKTDDQTIFAWSGIQGQSSGLLAPSPAHFSNSKNVRIKQDRELAPHTMTSLGVSVECLLFPLEMNTYVALLQCETNEGQVTIYVCKTSSSSQYRRIRHRSLCLGVASDRQISNAKASTIFVPNEDLTLQLKPHAGLPLIQIQSNLQAWLFRSPQNQERPQNVTTIESEAMHEPIDTVSNDRQHAAEISRHDVERAMDEQAVREDSGLDPYSVELGLQKVTHVQFSTQDLQKGVAIAFSRKSDHDPKVCYVLEIGFDRNFRPVCILQVGPFWVQTWLGKVWAGLPMVTTLCFLLDVLTKAWGQVEITTALWFLPHMTMTLWALASLTTTLRGRLPMATTLEDRLPMATTLRGRLPMVRTFWVDGSCDCKRTQNKSGFSTSHERCEVCFPQKRDSTCLKIQPTLLLDYRFCGIMGDHIRSFEMQPKTRHDVYISRGDVTIRLDVLPKSGLNWQLNFFEAHLTTSGASLTKDVGMERYMVIRILSRPFELLSLIFCCIYFIVILLLSSHAVSSVFDVSTKRLLVSMIPLWYVWAIYMDTIFYSKSYLLLSLSDMLRHIYGL